MFYFEYLYKGISMELLGGDKLKFKAVQALGMLCLGVSGLLTTVVLLLSRNMSWGRIMLVTPSSMLITGGLFYLSACGFLPVSLTKALGLGKVMSNGFWNIEIANTIFEGAPIEHSVAVIVLGAIQGFISKTSKYMFFDVAKERAFLLATYEERTVGKNAMESVVARFGKAAAASSLTTIMVPLLRYATSDTSTQSARLVLPYMGVIIAGLFAMFFYQVLNLIRIYNRRLSIYKKNNQVVPENIIELQDIEEVPEASQPQAKEAPEADEVVTDHMSSIHYADEEDEEADILGPFEEGEALSSDEDAEEVDLEEQAEV
jgi:hypothetical protein